MTDGRRMSRWWFISRPDFLLYVVRELTAIPVAIYAINLGVGALCLGAGTGAWRAWVSAQGTIPGLILSAVVLAASVLHAATWFAVSPKLVPVSIRRRIPGYAITIAQWLSLGSVAAAMWVALSWVGAWR
jgi:fumarate reductase subunit C